MSFNAAKERPRRKERTDLIATRRVDSGYRRVSTQFLRGSLSPGARALLACILSCGPRWRHSAASWARLLRTNRNAISRLRNELVEAGYLTVAKNALGWNRDIWIAHETALAGAKKPDARLGAYGVPSPAAASGRETTVVPQEILRHERLSLRAKGVLLTMISLGRNWCFSKKGLLDILPTLSDKNSVDALDTLLNEIKAAGYLATRRYQNSETHRFEWQWSLTNVAVGEDMADELLFQDAGTPDTGMTCADAMGCAAEETDRAAAQGGQISSAWDHAEPRARQGEEVGRGTQSPGEPEAPASAAGSEATVPSPAWQPPETLAEAEASLLSAAESGLARVKPGNARSAAQIYASFGAVSFEDANAHGKALAAKQADSLLRRRNDEQHRVHGDAYRYA